MASEPTVDGVEMVEVLDAAGRVERLVPRAEMRRDRLRHRAVSITVLRPGAVAVLVHRRAPWKDLWPSRWDIAFGGLCAVGETWADAAVRELAEEAGVAVEPGDLRPVGGGAYTDDDVDVVTEGFLVEHAGPFTFADGEVEEVAWVAIHDLLAWAAQRPVCPDTLHLARTTWLRAPS
jgi:isopentenyldiphosphate isomerase